jgi:hypothetical protein
MPRPRDRAPVLSIGRPMVDLLLSHGADVNARGGRAACQAARWKVRGQSLLNILPFALSTIPYHQGKTSQGAIANHSGAAPMPRDQVAVPSLCCQSILKCIDVHVGEHMIQALEPGCMQHADDEYPIVWLHAGLVLAAVHPVPPRRRHLPSTGRSCSC